MPHLASFFFPEVSQRLVLSHLLNNHSKKEEGHSVTDLTKDRENRREMSRKTRTLPGTQQWNKQEPNEQINELL